MSKQVSLYLLLGLVALVGVLFYRVIQPFIVPLFIAVVLAVLFEPLYHRLKLLLHGRKRISAAITTVCVVTLLIVPIGVVLMLAGGQMAKTGKQFVAWFDRVEGRDLERALENMNDNVIGSRMQRIYERLTEEQRTQLKGAVSSVSDGIASELYEKTRGVIANIFQSVIGFAIMTLGLYYFLSDGRTFLAELHRLLPFQEMEEQQLFEQFQSVCRGVVLGTIVAGLAQAALAGIAFGLLGIGQLWLLVVLTMFCSFIPFVGAVAVWGPVAVVLFLNDQYVAAVGLSLFGILVISTIDNLIRAHVIGSEARLHPLVALVTVLGAIQLIGLWGIFIGPMIAAIFSALAHILRKRITAPPALGDVSDPTAAPLPESG